MTFTQIITDLKAGKYAPVYFLHGDEAYYIDKISAYIQEHGLDEAEKAFNLHVVYGKDVDKPALIALARRYPMMAKHQVVIVREAQDIKNLIPKSESEKEKDMLLEYITNPVPSTVLVFAHKYKTLDKRTKLAKAIENNALIVTLGTLFSYFSKILIYHSLKEKTKVSVASSLGINPYFADEYMNAAKRYPREKVHSIISELHTYDLKSKGVESNAEDGE